MVVGGSFYFPSCCRKSLRRSNDLWSRRDRPHRPRSRNAAGPRNQGSLAKVKAGIVPLVGHGQGTSAAGSPLVATRTWWPRASARTDPRTGPEGNPSLPPTVRLQSPDCRRNTLPTLASRAIICQKRLGCSPSVPGLPERPSILKGLEPF